MSADSNTVPPLLCGNAVFGADGLVGVWSLLPHISNSTLTKKTPKKQENMQPSLLGVKNNEGRETENSTGIGPLRNRLIMIG